MSANPSRMVRLRCNSFPGVEFCMPHLVLMVLDRCCLQFVVFARFAHICWMWLCLRHQQQVMWYTYLCCRYAIKKEPLCSRTKTCMHIDVYILEVGGWVQPGNRFASSVRAYAWCLCLERSTQIPLGPGPWARSHGPRPGPKGPQNLQLRAYIQYFGDIFW